MVRFDTEGVHALATAHGTGSRFVGGVDSNGRIVHYDEEGNELPVFYDEGLSQSVAPIAIARAVGGATFLAFVDWSVIAGVGFQFIQILEDGTMQVIHPSPNADTQQYFWFEATESGHGFYDYPKVVFSEADNAFYGLVWENSGGLDLFWYGPGRTEALTRVTDMEWFPAAAPSVRLLASLNPTLGAVAVVEEPHENEIREGNDARMRSQSVLLLKDGVASPVRVETNYDENEDSYPSFEFSAFYSGGVNAGQGFLVFYGDGAMRLLRLADSSERVLYTGLEIEGDQGTQRAPTLMWHDAAGSIYFAYLGNWASETTDCYVVHGVDGQGQPTLDDRRYTATSADVVDVDGSGLYSLNAPDWLGGTFNPGYNWYKNVGDYVFFGNTMSGRKTIARLHLPTLEVVDALDPADFGEEWNHLAMMVASGQVYLTTENTGTGTSHLFVIDPVSLQIEEFTAASETISSFVTLE